MFWPAAELGPLDAGVSFFFVLSGFILTYVHRDLVLQSAPLRQFYLARLARIWPLHLICLAATMLLVRIPEPFNPWVLVANASLLHGWIPFDRYFFSYNYVSWSISTELAFYLAFRFLLAYARRWGFWLLIPALAIVATLVLWSTAAALPVWDTAHDHLSSTGLLYTNPLARFAEFLVGMASGCLFLRRAPPQAVSRGRWTLIEWATIGAFLMAYRYLFYGFATATHGITLGGTAIDGLLARQVIDEWANHVGLTPFAALLITVFALQRGAVSGWLSHPLMVFLGEISFALYLDHQIILRIVQQQQMQLDWLGFILYSIGSVIAASVLHLLLEKPLRRWLMRWPRLNPASAMQ